MKPLYFSLLVWTILFSCVFTAATKAQSRTSYVLPAGVSGFRNPTPGEGVALDSERRPTRKARVFISGKQENLAGGSIATQFVMNASSEERSTLYFTNFQASLETLFGSGGISSASRMAERTKRDSSTVFFLAKQAGAEQSIDEKRTLNDAFLKDLAELNQRPEAEAEQIRQYISETYGDYFVAQVDSGVKLSVACTSTVVESGKSDSQTLALLTFLWALDSRSSSP